MKFLIILALSMSVGAFASENTRAKHMLQIRSAMQKCAKVSKKKHRDCMKSAMKK